MLITPEALRKHPPAANINRVVTQPYTIPGTSTEIEKGVRVVIPVYAIHHDPRYYPEPDRFDPERFGDKAKASRPPYTYLPFGEGPRNCIGKPQHLYTSVLCTVKCVFNGLPGHLNIFVFHARLHLTQTKTKKIEQCIFEIKAVSHKSMLHIYITPLMDNKPFRFFLPSVSLSFSSRP